MAATNFVSLLTFFPETVAQGVGPNGDTSGAVSTAAQWLAAEAGGTAFQLGHIAESLDMSGVDKETLTAEQTKQRIFQTDARVDGLPAIDVPLSAYLTGSGVTTAAGTTISLTPEMRWLQHCLGGIHRTETVTLAGGGHTTTVINVDDATTLAEGAHVAWIDPATGLGHTRRIDDVTGLAVTLDRELPSVPADGEECAGTATIFINEDVICDTSAATGRTLSILSQKRANGTSGWEKRGCKAAVTSLGFERNGFATAEYQILGADFTAPPDGPAPTMPDFTSPRPIAIGPDTEVTINDVNDTTRSLKCNGSFAVEPGVPVVAAECMGMATDAMPGIGYFTTEPADTKVTVDVFPFAESWFTDFANGQHKSLYMTRLGTPGNMLAVGFPYAEIFNIPKLGDANGAATNALEFRAKEVDGATTALARSKFCIVIG